jgi:hypothetical protein
MNRKRRSKAEDRAVAAALAKAHQLVPPGTVPDSWLCVDCGMNTAPGCLNRADMEKAFKSSYNLLSATGKGRGVPQHFDEWSEVYTVRPKVWERAGMADFGGCLCIGCLEKRLGRRLEPKDFDRRHPFNSLPGTERLLSRREWSPPEGQSTAEPEDE